MIRLRELKEKDAPFMLEWMLDPETQKYFQRSFLSMSIADAEEFCNNNRISESVDDGESLHFAIVDANDEYLGTISLKRFDNRNKSAEYSICLRKEARGKGCAFFATNEILKRAFYTYGLHKVYLNVLSYNEKAINLYKRSGFIYEGTAREHVLINGKYESLDWYSILEEEYIKGVYGKDHAESAR